jgi:putative intracellular protease/amidase
MTVLIVLTSHDQLGDTGKKTGFWLEEFAAPYYVLSDAGAAITLASPKGGQPPLDPKSDLPENLTELTKRFRTDNAAQALLANTKKLADVSADDFDAVFYPGGHGPMWDMPDNKISIALIEAFVKADKPIGAVCHAPAAIVNVRGKDGEYLVKSKHVTGFTNAEEEAVGFEQGRAFLAGRPSKGTRWHIQQRCRLGSQCPSRRQACDRAEPGFLGTSGGSVAYTASLYLN